MYVRIRTAAVVILVALAATKSNAQSREWTDNTGRYKIQAELVEVTAEGAKLRRADGSVTTVPLNRLSAADQNYVQQLGQMASKTDTPRSATAEPPSAQPLPRSSGMDRYPLRADGTPDFEKYVLERSRQGVTPENNAATLIWQVMWVDSRLLTMDEFVDIDRQKKQVVPYLTAKYARFHQEIGVPGLPPKADVLRDIYGEASRKRVEQWMSARGLRRPPAGRGTFSQMFAGDADAIIDQALKHPWTSAMLPPLAEWVRENERPLNRIVEASRRPRYYTPSPDWLNDVDQPLFEMILAHSQEMRGVVRDLSARAMWHLGEGRVDEARQDILANQRLARLISQQLNLVEQLVAVALDGMAANSTITLLNDGKTTAAQARDVLRELSALSYLKEFPESIDTVERASTLDIVLLLKSGKTYSSGFNGDLLDVLDQLSATRLREAKERNNSIKAAARQVTDWDAVLARINAFFDRLVAAARMPAGTARKDAIAALDAELKQADVRKTESAAYRQLRGFEGLSPPQRSEAIASIMLGLLAPAIGNALSAQDRGNTVLEMTRLAAALAACRAERGQYPDKLDDLVPGILAKLPVDAFNAKPFVYRREGNGYLLYSLGANGVDNAGVGPFALVREFQEGMDDAQRQAHQAKTRAGADDVSLQLPLPAFDWDRLLSPK